MTRLLILALALAPLTACSNNDDRDAVGPDAAASDPGDAERYDASDAAAEGYGEPIRGKILAREADADGQIEIGVTDEVLFIGLTPAAKKEVRQEIDREIPEDGIGGMIGRAVSGVVDNALATTGQVPLESVRDLRYEDGRLILDAEADNFNVQINGDDREGIAFDEDAARRLIDAYERVR